MNQNPLKSEQLRLLTEILKETERIGPIRAWFVGLFFPEFNTILGRLSDLAGITERNSP